ncbi:MAG: hypothetical protein U0165_14905 [Polyangiaceae bacterium]
MNRSPRFLLHVVLPLLGLFAVACSSSDDGAADNPAGSAGSSNAGAAGSSGSSGAAGTAGSAGSAAAGGTAGSAGSAGSGGTAGAAGSPICVGQVNADTTLGLSSPMLVTATQDAVFLFDHDPLLGGRSVWRSTDGEHFSLLDIEVDSPIMQAASTREHVYFATSGRLFEADSTLSSYHEVAIPEGTWSVGEIRTTADRVVVPLDASIPYTSTGDGQWTRLGDPNTDVLASVFFAVSDGESVFAAGGCVGGIVVRTPDGIWTQAEGVPEWGYSDITLLPDGTVLASRIGASESTDVSLARLNAGESTWSLLPSIVSTGGLKRLTVKPSGEVIGTGAKGAFVSADHGDTWTLLAGTQAAATSAAFMGETLFVAGDSGLLRASLSDANPSLSTLELRTLTPLNVASLGTGLAVSTATGWFSWSKDAQRYGKLLDGQAIDVKTDHSGHVVVLKNDRTFAISDNGGDSFASRPISGKLAGELIPTLAGVANGNAYFSSAPWQGGTSCNGGEAPTSLASAGLFRRASNNTFKQVVDGLPVVQVNCLTGEERYPQALLVQDSPFGIVLLTDHAGVFLSQDDGLSWALIPGTELVTGVAVAGSNLWFSTGSALYRSSDAGAHLDTVSLPDGVKIQAITSWQDHLALAVDGATSAVLYEASSGELQPLSGLEGKSASAIQADGQDLVIGVVGDGLYRVSACN